MWFWALGGCMWARNSNAIRPHVCTTLNFVVSIIFWRTDGKENNTEMPPLWGGGGREREREKFRATQCICAVLAWKKKGFHWGKDSLCVLREAQWVLINKCSRDWEIIKKYLVKSKDSREKGISPRVLMGGGPNICGSFSIAESKLKFQVSIFFL